MSTINRTNATAKLDEMFAGSIARAMVEAFEAGRDMAKSNRPKNHNACIVLDVLSGRSFATWPIIRQMQAEWNRGYDSFSA